MTTRGTNMARVAVVAGKRVSEAENERRVVLAPAWTDGWRIEVVGEGSPLEKAGMC